MLFSTLDDFWWTNNLYIIALYLILRFYIVLYYYVIVGPSWKILDYNEGADKTKELPILGIHSANKLVGKGKYQNTRKAKTPSSIIRWYCKENKFNSKKMEKVQTAGKHSIEEICEFLQTQPLLLVWSCSSLDQLNQASLWFPHPDQKSLWQRPFGLHRWHYHFH